MPADQVTLLSFLLGLSPIIVVLVLMIQFKWGGARAGPVGWLTALLVSLLFFGARPSLLAYSQMRALLLTLYVLYVIWMALMLYNTVAEAGAIGIIGQGIIKLTRDRILQLLLLSWVFSGFLQGIAGYGVPIAVVAPLLIGLGFEPILSVVAVSIGHAWAVNFGSIAASFNALIAASGLPGQALAPWSAILLGVSCFACGIAVVYLYDGLRALRHALPAILIAGTVMSSTQYLLATSGLWNVSAFMAGLAGLGIIVLLARLRLYRPVEARDVMAGAPAMAVPAATAAAAIPAATAAHAPAGKRSMPVFLAMSPYALLVVGVTVAELWDKAHAILNGVKIQMAFPATTTALGWVTRAGNGQSISVFGHAGALLIYTSLAAYILFMVAGRYRPGAAQRILSGTLRSAVRSSIGITTMVGFALIMEQSGMTNAIATGVSRGLPGVYPFVAPFIGLLGSFMTGSNTNSNVVFAALQNQTATLLALPAPLILAAQTAGGSIGGMLAPARIIVGCSTAGLAGQEGQVLRRTIVVGLIITALLGLIALIAAR